MKWAQFWLSILPELTELARVLYQRFKGDVKAAKVEIQRMRDHSATWREERARGDAEMQALKFAKKKED